MRTAIIGTGFVADMHARFLRSSGHQIVAAVNPHREKAEAFARRWGIDHSTDHYQQAFELGVDTVHICTPPTSHYAIARDALHAGIHVFCEKPLCLLPSEAWELHHLACQKHRVTAVNFNNRFYEVCGQAKKSISAPDFGQIKLIHGAYLQEFHVLPEYYSWRYQPEMAGPMRAVTEIGSHWIDLVRFWTGLEIAAVSAAFTAFTPQRFLTEGMMHAQPHGNAETIRVDSEDASAISLRFSNSAMGSLLLSEVSHGRVNQLKLEVSSPTQSLWWNSEEPYQLHQAQKFAGVITHTSPFGGGFNDSFNDCFLHFYADVTAGQPALQPRYATFLDGALNASVCAAIYASAMDHSVWVDVQSA